MRRRFLIALGIVFLLGPILLMAFAGSQVAGVAPSYTDTPLLVRVIESCWIYLMYYGGWVWLVIAGYLFYLGFRNRSSEHDS